MHINLKTNNPRYLIATIGKKDDRLHVNYLNKPNGTCIYQAAKQRTFRSKKLRLLFSQLSLQAVPRHCIRKLPGKIMRGKEA
jgi:hypothetical protein